MRMPINAHAALTTLSLKNDEIQMASATRRGREGEREREGEGEKEGRKGGERGR